MLNMVERNQTRSVSAGVEQRTVTFLQGVTADIHALLQGYGYQPFKPDQAGRLRFCNTGCRDRFQKAVEHFEAALRTLAE